MAIHKDKKRGQSSHNLAHGMKDLEHRNKIASMSMAPKEGMMNTFERAVKNSSQDIMPKFEVESSI